MVFFEWISGQLGEVCSLSLVAVVQETGHPYWQHMSSDDCSAEFGRAIWTLGDLWRRLCLEVHGYPHTTFHLYGLPLDEFMVSLGIIYREYKDCRQCVDAELTEPILQAFIPFLTDYSSGAGEAGVSPRMMCQLVAAYHELQDLLGDLATVVPLSTDLVECLNGIVQHRLHSTNRHARTLRNSSEDSFLASVRTEHGSLVEWVKPKYLPPSHEHIRAMACNNRHKVKKCGVEKLEDTERIAKAKKRRIRSLSGCLA